MTEILVITALLFAVAGPLFGDQWPMQFAIICAICAVAAAVKERE